MPERRAREVEHDAVGFHDAWETRGINPAQAATDCLDEGALVQHGAQDADAADRLAVETFGQANYSSLRSELVEFRRRVQQLQHGVIAHQLCRPIWARWLDMAQLSGRLDLSDPLAARMVQWIPPRWDWVDPLKDIQAQVLAMEAGITSRRKVVEATGYDVEEVDRENAVDAKRVADLGLHPLPRETADRALRVQQ